MHPLKSPTPPPGICKSKWLSPRSPPVLVTCTTIFLPLTGPDVKVNLGLIVSKGFVSRGGNSLLIAGTAPVGFAHSGELSSSKPVGEVVVDCPWTLAGAHVGGASRLTAILGCHVGKRIVALVTALHRGVDGSLARPSA